jgi:ribonucleoside-diphosphate reductase alpha chain
MELTPGLQQPVVSRGTASRTNLIDSFFVKDGVCPTEKIRWVKRDVPELGNGHRYYVEAPEEWSERSVNIAAVHYLAPPDKDSVRSLVLRVATTIHDWAVEDGTFRDPELSRAFQHELTYILIHRIASFNSPVYYNIGLSATPQCSACFINSVEDSMDSITDLAKREARIFQAGSGAGVNWGRLRSSHEPVKDQGNSSGPVPFMVAHDSLASKIKSGGRKRRAARIDILDADHPDILPFIRDKADTEKIARMMADNGWSTDMNDPQSTCNVLPHQSTNLSVRIPDAFMEAALAGEDWDLHYRNREGIQSTVSAKELLHEMAQACWECGDPGVQFHDTINRWSLLQDIHELRATNPCGEYTGRDNTSCNLASINVMPPLRGPLDFDEIGHVARTLVVAQDTIVHHAGYPHDTIAHNTNEDRDIGLGWANLGALAMHNGFPYDSDEARSMVSNICSWTTAVAYETSLDLAQKHEPFHRADECQEGIAKVFHQHAKAIHEVDDASVALPLWDRLISRVEAGELPRNATVTLCAPTGTVALLMDCDTTGCEPAIALKSTKKLSYGGEMKMVIQAIEPALFNLGYALPAVHKILAQIETEGHLEGAVNDKHLSVFDAAFPTGPSGRTISYMGHLKMLAAMQPHLSMAMSKTVNLPNEITAGEIEQCIVDAWKMGIKNVALFRDGCKAAQPVNVERKKKKPLVWGDRRKMPKTRNSITHKVDIGGTEVYATVGLYEDGTPGELFFIANCGSTIDGLLDSVAIAVSHALQYGAPLEKLVEKYQGTKFAPDGWSAIGEQSRHFKSILDYTFTWIAHQFLTPEESPLEAAVKSILVEDRSTPAPVDVNKGELCQRCGNFMVPTGGKNCYLCHSCGSSAGGCG